MTLPERVCCEDMRRDLEQVCDIHAERWDCPDCLVWYSVGQNCYGLIVHNGGPVYSRIRFCPWCGTALPADPDDGSG